LTAERFIDVRGEPGMRIYLTRDLGYLEQDGCLIHVGRKDHQVKIYGKLISTQQIEECMLGIPRIREAVVVASNGASTETQLTAYYVCEKGAVVDPGAIRAHLASRFAAESVPKRFIALDAMPLNKNNKVDRQALLDNRHSPPVNAELARRTGA
jgi:acyl-coenzyme A synthetase/AMP-(fatty) acid ligase